MTIEQLKTDATQPVSFVYHEEWKEPLAIFTGSRDEVVFGLDQSAPASVVYWVYSLKQEYFRMTEADIKQMRQATAKEFIYLKRQLRLLGFAPVAPPVHDVVFCENGSPSCPADQIDGVWRVRGMFTTGTMYYSPAYDYCDLECAEEHCAELMQKYSPVLVS